MNQNNLNNKFGECCNCPALSNGDQYFTNYVSSRLYNDDLQKKLGIKDSNSFRINLQSNGTKYMSKEHIKYDNNRCKSDKKNNFYIDTSNYNFSTKLTNEYSTPNIPNNYVKKSQVSAF